MINRVILIGRLTKDPELRYTPSGIPVVRFTVAITRSFTGPNGERESDFIQCIAWRKQAENLANFQRKGNLIGIEGRIQTGSFEGQDGKRVYTTDVVADSVQFLEPKKSSGEQPQSQQQQQQPPPPQSNNVEEQAQYNYEKRMQEYQASKNEDPFAAGRKPVEVSEDLPF